MNYCRFSDETYRYVKETTLRNAQVEALTPAQHKALAMLATYRHKIHCNMDKLYYSTSETGEKYRVFLEKLMPIMLHQASLPALDLSRELSLLIRDNQSPGLVFAALPSDHYFQEMAGMIAERINVRIEEYLIRIDMTYGTHYAPSKVARLRTAA